MPALSEAQRENRKTGVSEKEDGVRRGLATTLDVQGTVGEGSAKGGGGGRDSFDLSVLCTLVNDVNHLFKDTYPVDKRLVDALLWNVKVRYGRAIVVVPFRWRYHGR